MSELYDATNTKEALFYYKIASAAKDSLYSSSNIQAIQALANQEQENQLSLEAQKTAYQNRIKQYGFLAGLGILLIVATGLYRNNRQKQKANNLLQQQKEEINIQKSKVEETLSELKSTQGQLIQSEKMASLGELTAGIAHEIQNPLNFVNNFSEVNNELLVEMKEEMDKGNLGEAKQIAENIIENSRKVLNHGKRADGIVKGMLQHAQASSGQKEPTDINALADEYFRLSYQGLRAKDKSFNASLQTHLDPAIGKINIVPQDIARVLLNLYNNAFYAVAHLPSEAVNGNGPVNTNPTVWLTTKKLGDKVMISVRDNGPGISQKVIDKIFQPFYTTKPSGQGTGLGLSLSYDIVKAHGGEIKLETKEGEGAEFSIQLPD